MNRRALFGTALAAASLPAALHAQSWPTRPLRLVVPYAPGGTSDIIARLVAPGMQQTLGQPVVIENRPGAGGNVGTGAVARAEPDGYSLVLGTGGTLTINPSIYASMPFDTQRDVSPVSLIAAVQNVMVVNPTLPVRSVQDFITYARARPGQVFFASPGVGSAAHMAGELLNVLAGLRMVHVPYRGSGPAMADLMAGQGVQVALDNLPTFIGAIRDGRLRGLAVTATRRSPALPDMPTMQEAGVDGFEVTTVFGMLTTGGVPPAILARLHRETVASVRRPDVTARLEQLGAEPVASTPEEFADVIARDIQKWRDVTRRAGITPQ
jgi:tripartite-type tricarboxylate transporter receptor subunit TctC